MNAVIANFRDLIVEWLNKLKRKRHIYKKKTEQIYSSVRQQLPLLLVASSIIASSPIFTAEMTRETWPTAEDKARSPSPQFISRQLSRVDYEEEDPEAEQLIADGPPLVRVPLFRTGNPTTFQNAASTSHEQSVPAKHQEEENPMDLEDIVSKQVELTHEHASDDQDVKGDEIAEDPTVEIDPYTSNESLHRGGVSFILGGSMIPKKVEKQTDDSLYNDESQLYQVNRKDSLERN